MVKRKKVLVVGAGPAGASTAYFLKRGDEEDKLDVKIIERLDETRHPLYHDMCGEVISEKLLSEVGDMPVKGIVEKIHTAKEYWPGDITITTKIDGLAIDRNLLLEAIRETYPNLGIEYGQASLSSLAPYDNITKVRLGDKVESYDYVIGADGANSIVRKSIGAKGRITTAMQFIVDEKPDPGVIHIHYDEMYKADYKWIFPHGSNTKIGFPLESHRHLPEPKFIVAKQARSIGFGGVDKYVMGNILLVGDAACQSNPLTKGGIRSGIIAGKLAAEAVLNERPQSYQEGWMKTGFSNGLFMKAYNDLTDMKNDELFKHIKPFGNYKPLYTELILLLKYQKYLHLYKAYKLTEKFGW